MFLVGFVVRGMVTGTYFGSVWTDGSREDFSSLGGFENAGAGVYLHASEVAFDSSVWRTAEE